MTACNHQWRRSHGNLETCNPCGKVRYRELVGKDMNERQPDTTIPRGHPTGQPRPIVLMKKKEIADKDQNRDTIIADERQVELEKIKRELLTLAQRVEKLLAA